LGGTCSRWRRRGTEGITCPAERGRLDHGGYGETGRAAARLFAKEGGIMGRSATIVLYVLAMVVVVVGVDVLFFRNHFWPRLMANVGIVLVFGAFYFRFLQRT
jgi:hypothetical protein